MSSTPYDRQTSFALFSAENPTSQQSGSSLDAEFNAVKIAVDDTQQNLAKIQDDDGVLKRGSVGKAQFDASVTLGFAAPSQWASGILYTAQVNTVFHDSIFYIANATHTSGATFDASKWDEIADFTAAAAITDGSITSAKLAAGAVAGDKLADGVVANTKIATGAVSTNKIADQNVTTQKLADGATTFAKLASDANRVIPAGALMPYAGATVPDGWLICGGQSLLRTDYPALFAAVGTTYGSADGTHFNVPDMRSRVPVGKDDMGGSGSLRMTSTGLGANPQTLGASGGAETRALLTANLPPYTPAGAVNTGTVAIYNGTNGVASPGSASVVNGGTISGTSGSQSTNLSQFSGFSFTGTPQGGTSTPFSDVQPSLVLNYIIKAH